MFVTLPILVGRRASTASEKGVRCAARCLRRPGDFEVPPTRQFRQEQAMNVLCAAQSSAGFRRKYLDEVPVEYEAQDPDGSRVSLFGYAAVPVQFEDHFERSEMDKTAAAERKQAAAIPGVFVIHTAAGPHEDFMRDVVRQVAKLGCVAFAVDMFGIREQRPPTSREKYQLMELFRQKPPHLMRARLHAALEAFRNFEQGALRVDTQRMGAIGYCFGGSCTMELARMAPDGIRACVSFHGVLDESSDKSESPAIAANVLCFHGDRDPLTTPAALQRFERDMERRNPPSFSVRRFESCMHGFTRPDKVTAEDAAGGMQYDREAAELAWNETKRFLQQHLTIERHSDSEM